MSAVVLPCLVFWFPLQSLFLRDKEAACLIPLAAAFLAGFRRISIPPSWSPLAGLFLLAWGCLSCLWAPVPSWSLSFVLTLSAGPLFMLALWGEPHLAKRVLAAGVAAAGLSACYGLVQVAGGDPFQGRWSGSFQGRAFSTLGNPDYLGGHMIPAFFGALCLGGKAGGLAAILTLAALVGSGSRGPALAAVAGVAILAGLVWSRKSGGRIPEQEGRGLRKVLGAAFVAGLLLLLSAPGKRILSSLDFGSFGVQSRVAHARTALQMVRERPLLGVGYGQFAREYPLAAAARGQAEPYHLTSHAHNEALQAWAEGGPLALIAFLVFVLSWPLAALAKAWNSGAAFQGRAGAGGAALALYGFTNFPWQIAATAALGGVLAASSSIPGGPSTERRAISVFRFLTVVAVLLLALASARRQVPDAALKTALGEWSQARPQEAKAAGLKSLNLEARRAETLRLLFQIESQAGHQGAGEEYLAQADSLEPGDLRHLLPLANLRGARGDHAGAEALFRRAMALSPEAGPPRLGLAIALFGGNRLPEALAVLEESTVRVPGDAELWHALGVVRGRMGLYPQAVAAFRRALEIKPDHQASAQALAQTEGALGKPR